MTRKTSYPLRSPFKPFLCFVVRSSLSHESGPAASHTSNCGMFTCPHYRIIETDDHQLFRWRQHWLVPDNKRAGKGHLSRLVGSYIFFRMTGSVVKYRFGYSTPS